MKALRNPRACRPEKARVMTVVSARAFNNACLCGFGRAAFRAGQERGAELRRDRAAPQRLRDIAAVHQAARGDHRNFHIAARSRRRDRASAPSRPRTAPRTCRDARRLPRPAPPRHRRRRPREAAPRRPSSRCRGSRCPARCSRASAAARRNPEREAEHFRPRRQHGLDLRVERIRRERRQHRRRQCRAWRGCRASSASIGAGSMRLSVA